MHVRKNGFSIPEFIMAITISVLVSAGIVSILFFFGRDINSKFREEQAIVQTDRAVHIIKQNLMNTGRGAGSFTSPLHIAKDGSYIKFQVLTPDSNGLLISQSNNTPNWGDGTGPSGLGHWIEYRIQAGNLVRNILASSTSVVPIKTQTILESAAFTVDSIQFDSNSVEILTCPTCTGEITVSTRVIRITVSKLDDNGNTLYSKTFTIKLRNE